MALQILIVLFIVSNVPSAHAETREKLQSRLLGAVTLCESAKSHSSRTFKARLTAYAKENHLTVINNKILVELFVTDTSAVFLKSLLKYGIKKDRGYGRLNDRVQALVPVTRLGALARDTAIRWVQAPGEPHPQLKPSIE